ncbi:serine protein kinase RIO [Lacisediminihabitans sp. H27-G8]|uniref:serine protein kinase RIO n=1 Tax=Lacisediminihabitans sp. H27-G8 TaxID=3111909 RepID=UPI0038FC5485
MSSESPSFSVPSFSELEPGEGQRWSTWFSTVPSQRGPRPFPEWVVVETGAFETELGIVKSGKEADVFLIERAVPGSDRSSILAAKRYRGPETSDFHRSSQYREGRGMRRSRDTRAVARGSTYGRSVAAGAWVNAEFEALCTMYERGVAVPYPVQVLGTELLMEFVGDGTQAAPRLAQVRASADHIADYFAQVRQILLGFARAGSAHGDLSPYNLLVHHGRVIAIDLPQLVEVVSNPNGMVLLLRDCVNVCDWFARHGLDCDAEVLYAEAVAELY